jgi:hypothetical protein
MNYKELRGVITRYIAEMGPSEMIGHSHDPSEIGLWIAKTLEDYTDLKVGIIKRNTIISQKVRDVYLDEDSIPVMEYKVIFTDLNLSLHVDLRHGGGWYAYLIKFGSEEELKDVKLTSESGIVIDTKGSLINADPDAVKEIMTSFLGKTKIVRLDDDKKTSSGMGEVIYTSDNGGHYDGKMIRAEIRTWLLEGKEEFIGLSMIDLIKIEDIVYDMLISRVDWTIPYTALSEFDKDDMNYILARFEKMEKGNKR